MQQPMTRPGNHVMASYEKYAEMLYRIALIHLGSRQDAEEATQDTFIKLMEKAPAFKDDEHQKAWLIRVITNHCKNLLGRGWRKREVKLEGTGAGRGRHPRGYGDPAAGAGDAGKV